MNQELEKLLKDPEQKILSKLDEIEIENDIDRECNYIRKILSMHRLEPKSRTPLAQECADLIEEAERRAKENGRGDVAYRNAIHRLKLFLKDGKTSFFVGKDTPFDPTLCGFKLVMEAVPYLWENAICVLIHVSATGLLYIQPKYEDDDDDDSDAELDAAVRPTPWVDHCPWPLNHSDGEKLLKLLGVF